MIWFFLSLVAFLYFFAHSLIMEKIEISFYWNKGLVPPWTRRAEHTYLYIYVALAGLLFPRNQEVRKYPKLGTLYKFILANKRGRLPLVERESYHNKLVNMLRYSIAHPIQLEAVTKWADYRQISESKRVLILRFLVDFVHTGTISTGKREILSRISKSLHLSEEQLKQIIEDHKEAEKQEKQEQQRKSRTGSKICEHAKCCAILGVSTDASMEEIKRSYRKLVHSYHPDRFENASAEEYQVAQQKFIEIQHAYETLEKMMVK